MKYDFETIIDRDPAIRGTGKYRIMKDSKGNKPPKGIVPLSVADMEFRTAPCVIDAIKAEADFGVLGYHRLTDSFRESCCQWMKTRHDWDVQPDWIVPFEQVVPALYNAVWTFTQPGRRHPDPDPRLPPLHRRHRQYRPQGAGKPPGGRREGPLYRGFRRLP